MFDLSLRVKILRDSIFRPVKLFNNLKKILTQILNMNNKHAKVFMNFKEVLKIFGTFSKSDLVYL